VLEKKKEAKKKQLNEALRYSALGFQMLVLVLVFVFLGMYLDDRMQIQNGLFTASFSIMGVIISVYFAIKDLLKQK
jgi:hypothetical protein